MGIKEKLLKKKTEEKNDGSVAAGTPLQNGTSANAGGVGGSGAKVASDPFNLGDYVKESDLFDVKTDAGDTDSFSGVTLSGAADPFNESAPSGTTGTGTSFGSSATGTSFGSSTTGTSFGSSATGTSFDSSGTAGASATVGTAAPSGTAGATRTAGASRSKKRTDKKALKEKKKKEKAEFKKKEKEEIKRNKARRKKFKDIKKVSKIVLKEQLGELMVIRLISMWVSSVVSVMTFFVGGMIVSGPLKYGLYDSYYKAAKGEKIKASNLNSGAKNRFGDSFLAGLVVKVIAGVPLGLLVALIISVIAMLSSVSTLADFIDLGLGKKTLIISAITIVAVIACDIVCWILLYSFTLAQYVLIRNPGMSGFEALKFSGKLMKHEKFRFLRFDISFVLWYLLTPITAGISLLWTLPYHLMGRVNMMTEIYERKVTVKIDKLEYYRPYNGPKRQLTREYNALTDSKDSNKAY